MFLVGDIMNITLNLMNNLGDEIGDVALASARVVAAGIDTAVPDLARQMSQLLDRLNHTLWDLSLVPVLAPMEVRIAVSRALLKPTPRGIVIPLQVRAMDETMANPVACGCSSGAAAGAASGADEWDGLFDLGTETKTDAGAGTASAGSKVSTPASGDGGLDDLDCTNQPDEWESLGRAWDMDRKDDDEEGGWK